MKKRFLLTLTLGLTVGGCTLMPEYERPVAPVSENWSVAVTPANTNQLAAADIEWRDFFGDPQLKQLIEIALVNNRDLRIVGLQVEQVRAQYRIQRAALFPGFQGDVSMLRQKNSERVNSFNGGGTFTTYEVSLDAAYEIDFFGRIRSLKKEALETYLASEEGRKSAQISLISGVASEYLNWLQLKESQEIARRTLEAVQQSAELNQQLLDAGVASELEFQISQAQIQIAKVDLADFQQLLDQSENSLTLLIGQPLPEDFETGGSLENQALLMDLPVGIPSEALQRRPDVIAAEHQLIAANANIGAARAAFFPKIQLTGSVGTASADLSDLFTGPSTTWNFSPRIIVPIFEAGSTRARLDTSKLQKEIEIANYEKAIQSAFREVADALAVRSVIDEKLAAQELLLRSQQKRFDLTSERYQQGVDSYVDVLQAQEDLYAAQQGLLQFRSARLQNAVSLYRSLGGGWSQAEESL